MKWRPFKVAFAPRGSDKTGDCMIEEDLHSYAPMLFVLLLGLGFAGAFLLLSQAFGPKKPKADKLDVYECGVPTLGDARERFNVRFFMIAMVFLLFDVEVVFLFPWAILANEFKHSALPGVATLAFFSMLLFMIVLGVGLFYEWKKGALDWEA